jgi:phage host-nuclease inhibitor protein Gam
MSDHTSPTPHLSGDTSVILHALGELRGEMRVANQVNSQRFADLRADIARLEGSINDRISRVEESFQQQLRDHGEQLGKRMDGLGNRVTNLEAEDKRLIEKVAKVSALGGSLSGGLIAGAIELLKHVGK